MTDVKTVKTIHTEYPCGEECEACNASAPEQPENGAKAEIPAPDFSQIKQELLRFSGIMSISGYESYETEKLCESFMPYFDEYYGSPNLNHVFIKRCGKENAPRLLIDAHYDEIGMMVTQLKDGGFLKVCAIGGLDTRILLAGEVIIYANEPVYGVVCATPPHLQKPGENNKLPPVGDLLIDTGFTKDELLQKGVDIGTPVGFKPVTVELLNDKIAGKGFDNKACGVVALETVKRLSGKELDFDIYVLLSAKEEVGMVGGKVGSYEINPDAAIVLDVNFANAPDCPGHRCIKMGEGAGVSISAVTDRRLTRAVIDFAKEKELKCQTIVEATGTGTNAGAIHMIREGVPAVVVSLPLKNMHTYSEVAACADVDDMARLLSEFISGGLVKWYRA